MVFQPPRNAPFSRSLQQMQTLLQLVGPAICDVDGPVAAALCGAWVRGRSDVGQNRRGVIIRFTVSVVTESAGFATAKEAAAAGQLVDATTLIAAVFCRAEFLLRPYACVGTGAMRQINFDVSCSRCGRNQTTQFFARSTRHGCTKWQGTFGQDR
jgi:hypothetical protein